MGAKSILKKVGKVALMAAPYVAAPFTGGASLMATGLANKAVSKWSEHDAKDAIAHGLAPSKFDQRLNTVGNVSSLASAFIPTNALGSIGMLGKAAKAGQTASKVAKAGEVASKVSTAKKAASIIGNVNKYAGAGTAVAGMVARSRGNTEPGSDGTRTSSSTYQPSTRTAPAPGAVMPRGGYRYNQNPMNQEDQSSPNLAKSIFQGRQESIKNQPFRHGYDVNTQIGEPDDEGKYEIRTTRMPKIYDTGGRGGNRGRQQAAY